MRRETYLGGFIQFDCRIANERRKVAHLFLSVSVSMSMRVCLLRLLCSGSGPVSAVSTVTSCEMMSMGTGNTMVLLFSADILFRVWRYLCIVKHTF